MSSTKSKARQYKRITIRRLDILSGNECASPTCDKPLIAKDGESIISKICHIEAASKKWVRFNPNMSDDARKDYDNLILLCDECHNIIDNPTNENIYTVELLKQWKKTHEDKIMMKLVKRPSLLYQAVKAIIHLSDNDGFSQPSNKTESFSPSEKIQYNSVIRNRFLLDKYKVFYGKINILYKDLETQGGFKKENLLNFINKLYLIEKGKYVIPGEDELISVQKNSDNIIEGVTTSLLDRLSKEIGFVDENIDFSVTVIIVDAFMRCKILEEPYDN